MLQIEIDSDGHNTDTTDTTNMIRGLFCFLSRPDGEGGGGLSIGQWTVGMMERLGHALPALAPGITQHHFLLLWTNYEHYVLVA